MNRFWPFHFFPSTKDNDTSNEENVTAEATDAVATEVPVEEVDTLEEDDEEDLPDLEEELEIALAKAHEEEVAKNRERTKVIAGLAILGAAGLATGFGIRSYIKKRKN